MKDVTVYSEDSIFSCLLLSEIKKLGKSVNSQNESCILLVVDIDCAGSDSAISEIAHTFTLGISREISQKGELDALLKRPVSLKELRDTVNALLERKSVSVFKNEEEKDEIILLTDRKSVLFNGNKIGLTPNEFLLLERLLERQGCPVSREEINTLLCADGNTSDVYICMLRKKLTHNRRSPVITIRGKGYMIE